MSCKNKSFITKKKAFTLIELLIVIAIIGILFIVLVSKVDFATDKAKATGVQTDFRSFQLAFDTVAKEQAGFNSFGWNTGDANANGIRDSYDEGDNGAGGGTEKNGIQDGDEVFTGHKVYDETWTDKYSLIRPGTTFAADGYDKDAIFALETAINKNLDPKLHITIDAKTGLITMANGAQDPWNTQYHGAYISAEDGMDRGAIVMYSNGANQKLGSEHDIDNGVVNVSIPGNNKYGKDDYSIVSCYTYLNGYGEVLNLSTGFGNNQGFLSNNPVINNPVANPDDNVSEPELPDFSTVVPGLYASNSNYQTLLCSWESLLSSNVVVIDGMYISEVTEDLSGDLIIGSGASRIYTSAFEGFINLDSIVIGDTITNIGTDAFYECTGLKIAICGTNVKTLGDYAFQACIELETFILDSNVTKIKHGVFFGCESLTQIHYKGTIEQWNAIEKDEEWCDESLKEIVCSDGIVNIN